MKKLLLCVILCSIGITSFSQTYYVNVNATGANNGSSWADAATDLNYATYNVMSGEIWVAAGTYVPNLDYNGNFSPTTTQSTFRVRGNVKVYGGFNGTETASNQRDWVANPTILSGNMGGGNYKQNVVRFYVNTNATVLDGFIIKDGYATTNLIGGGIYCDNASPVIRNCTFENNKAQNQGGAIFFNDGAATVINCKLINNQAVNLDGGAVYVSNTAAVDITNCLFDNNSAPRYGGAVLHTGSTGNIVNCTFLRNTSGNYGKAIIATGGSNLTIKNGVFYGNTPLGSEVVVAIGATINISYSYNFNGTAEFYNVTTSNIVSGAPQFMDYANGDYTFTCGGPGYNSGDTIGLTLPATDLNGNNRFVGLIDMGAYENNTAPGQIGVTANKTSVCAGESVTLNGTCDLTGFNWDNGVTNNTPFFPTVTQTYTCTGINSGDTEQITIYVVNVTDQVVSAPSNVCTGTTATVTLANSNMGASYFLRNNTNDAVIDGPVAGTGGAINFTTNIINTAKTYNVFGSSSSATSMTGTGYKLTFDGINDHISSTVPSNFNYNSSYTFEAWIKSPLPNSVSYPIFFAGTSTSSDVEIYVQAASNDLYIVHNRGNGASMSSGFFADPPNNVLYHLAVVFNGSSVEAFYNGVSKGVKIISPPLKTSTAQIKMGTVDNINWAGANDQFYGELNDIRWWNTARTSTQVLDNMSACLIPSENGLVANYRLDEGTGSAIYNSVTGLSATLNNMDNADWLVSGSACDEFAVSTSCSLEMAQTVTIAPTTVDISTTINSATITATQTGATYRWLDCDNSNAVISGATSQNYTAAINGSYAVEVTLNGCTDTSACVNMTTVGIQQINVINMSISPNPVKNVLNINAEEKINKLSIYNINGSLVQHYENGNNSIDVSYLTKGMYILVVQSEKGISQNKFIKE